MTSKPFAVDKSRCSGTAVQHPREGQFEVQQQLDPPRKRRANSIPSITDEAFEWEDNSQYTDDRAKKQRRRPIHTEAKDSVDNPCGGTKPTANNGTERKVGKCWLMTTKSSDSRFGWKAGNPLEDEDSGEEGAPWKGDFVRIEAALAGDHRRVIDFPSDLAQTYRMVKRDAFVMPAGSQLSFNNTPNEPVPTKAGKGLPHWVHPKWTTVFLPTLSHALFISKQPFQEFKPSSPIFVATVQQILKLVYSHGTYVTKDDVLVEEAAQRLATKRSKIASAIMGEVKSFFEQDAYVNRPDQVKAYVSWALQPDGPAFHETPTPSTCTFKRDHQEYIHPKGTFQPPIMNSVAKHFLLQAKGSVLDPPISASNPPKGLYGLLLVSVERAFTAFKSGVFKKPTAKFSHENYRAQLKTYLGHLDTMQPALWEEILYRTNTSDVLDTPQSDFADDSSTVSISQNLYIPNLQ